MDDGQGQAISVRVTSGCQAYHGYSSRVDSDVELLAHMAHDELNTEF